MQNVMFTGAPVAPDARRMLDTLLAMAAGTTVSYVELAAVVGPDLDPRSKRFDRVLRSALNLLLESENEKFVRVAGIGVRRVPENERVVVVAQKVRKGTRVIARAAREAGAIRTERLSANEQKTALHVRRVLDATCADLQRSRKEIAHALTPPKALPRGQ